MIPVSQGFLNQYGPETVQNEIDTPTSLSVHRERKSKDLSVSGFYVCTYDDDVRGRIPS